jgi:hypothetical protein
MKQQRERQTLGLSRKQASGYYYHASDSGTVIRTATVGYRDRHK